MYDNDLLRKALKEAKGRKDWGTYISLCRETIGNAPISSIEETYLVKLKLAFALLQDSANLQENCEEAIAIYEELLLLSHVESLSDRWTSLHRNLGYTYCHRMEGDRNNNLLASIHHYEQAIKGMKSSEDVELSASIKAEIGFALMALRTGGAEYVDRAIECFKDALAVFTESGYPEEWREISDALEKLAEANVVTKPSVST